MKGPENYKSGGEYEIAFIIVGIVLAGMLVWYTQHEHIAGAVVAIRRFELNFIWFDDAGRQALAGWLSSYHPSQMTLKGLAQSAQVAGWELRWYVGGVLTLLFARSIMRAPDRGKYAKSYTMKTLAKQEAELWPTIKPVLDEKFIEIPLDDKINGMRQRGWDYAKRHRIVVLAASLPDDVDRNTIEDIDGRSVLLLDRARQVFARQLGPAWQGLGALRGHEKALFAAFAAQIANDRGLALAILNDLATAYVRAKRTGDVTQINTLRAQKALHQYGNASAVSKVVGRHAFKRTVLMSMLAAARANGVLPAAWFRWLKTVDRITWYALCDLGMDCASVEAAGIRSHWQAERMAKTPLMTFMIEEAVVGLKEYLGELLDEELVEE